MNFIFFALLGLVSTAFAALADLQKAIATINTSLLSLNQAIIAVRAPADVKNVGSGITRLTTNINDATKQFSAAPALTLVDAMSITTPVLALVTNAQYALGNLTAKAPTIKQGGQGPTILKGLKDGKTVIQQMSGALIAKVPAAVQSVAKQKTDEISKMVDTAITAYSK